MLGALPQFRRKLLAWYRANQRRLPWRDGAMGTGQPDPYHVLVSELMLQQTQVGTVIPYFTRFIERWPTLADLAAAGEQEVLRMWQGLGYYSRARNLLAAARTIAGEKGGVMPRTVDELRKLPGIGRYTAGAIASIAFGVRAAILDGNVMRVLCRLDGIEADPRCPAVNAALWQRAAAILPRERAGEFNSALMELGATVCTPRGPRCGACPVRCHCQARATGNAERIPPRARAKARPVCRRWVLCLRRGDRWLIEQRPAKGRWAGMWQFVTVEASGRLDDARAGELAGVRVKSLRSIGSLTHDLTHRRYEFEVFQGEITSRAARTGRRWVTRAELANYPLPRPQAKVAQMVWDGERPTSGARRNPL